MRVLDFSSVPGLSPLPPGTAACLGAFDGMHLGHQGLIARARSCGREVAVVTFEPRPADVLAPESAVARLQTPRQREQVCRELGVDTLVILRFDREVSRMSPQEFVQEFLLDGLRPAAVVVGYDFHFGVGRAGGPATLRDMLAPAGIQVSVVDKIVDATAKGGECPKQDGTAKGGECPKQGDTHDGAMVGEKLGSTAIRELIAAGDVERAALLLGRLYAIAGTVEHGAARGRGLGFPTANVRSPLLHPADGVYACFLSLLDSPRDNYWPAVANIGSNPTFAEPGAIGRRTLEVHALDVDLGDSLYEREVEVAFVARLRDERRFADVEQLRAAIVDDIATARPYLTDAAAARRSATRVEAGGAV
jgi:riboflavin kinase/FMN adenylyltransferase